MVELIYKNILQPNSAACTRFTNNLNNFGRYGADTVMEVSINPNTGNQCIKVTTPSSGVYEGIYVSRKTPMDTSLPYSTSFECWSNSSGMIRPYMGVTGPDGVNLPLVAGKNIIKYENHIPTGDNVSILTLDVLTLYFEWIQTEQGPIVTPYEFPGLDLTGETIHTHEQVNDITLQNLLKLTHIPTKTIIHDVIVQNILQLSGIKTKTEVYDTQLLNQLVLEAIETSSTVPELVAYIKYNYVKCKLSVTQPKSRLELIQTG